MRRRHHTFQFSLFILSVTLSIAKGLADCVVVLCLHCLASRKMLHFVQHDTPAGIKNNTRATVVVIPGVAREMCRFGYQLTQLKVVANNCIGIITPTISRFISLYRLCWYINLTIRGIPIKSIQIIIIYYCWRCYSLAIYTC